MVSDPIGDLLIQIKNAGLAGNHVISVPMSRTKLAVARILEKEKYIDSVETAGEKPKQTMTIHLKYQGKTHAIGDVKRVSKPGLRLYVKAKDIPVVLGGLGIAILSTPQGIMTGKDAKKHGIGGELLCHVW